MLPLFLYIEETQLYTLRIVFIITTSIFLFASSLLGQQTPQFSQQMFNKYQFNAAYAGFDRSLSITGSSRSQWATFDGAPTTQNLNAHLPFYIWNGGIGISLENDKIGEFSSTSVSMSYNYVYESPIGLFSAGIRVGVLQNRLNASRLTTPDGTYEADIIQHNDGVLANQNISGSAPIWSFAGYYISDLFETGLSISDLPTHTTAIGDIDLRRSTVVNWFAEANLPINYAIEITPSVFVKSDFVQTQLEIAGIANYRDQYFGGVGMRGYNANSLDAVIVYAGFRFNKKYKLTYSYDLGINGLQRFHEGTHEFVLNYNLQKIIGLGLPPKVIYNPRFL